MCKISVELPDDVIEKAEWFVKNMQFYDDMNDMVTQSVMTVLDMCMDETVHVRKPFPETRYF